MTGAFRVLVVVPAWNEEESIAGVVHEVRRTLPDVDVLVVDDGSTDQTAVRAGEAGALVARLPYNLGVGGAMRLGFRYAVEGGYDTVVQIDADGQHDPAFVPQLLDRIAAGQTWSSERVSPAWGSTARGAPDVGRWPCSARCCPTWPAPG